VNAPPSCATKSWRKFARARIAAKVRILRGTFADHPGIYDGASRKERERVLLEILGRMVPVDVAPADLEFVA
jgi:transcription antitermination factor NusG